MPAVLIIGGGIAGTAVALALTKAAVDATVYEAHPVSSHDRGAFLTLASNGMNALRQIDADTVVCAASAPLRTMRVCTDQGQQIATVALGATHDPTTGYRYLTRAALRSALQREVQDRGIRIERGKRLTQVTAHHHGVTAIFSDGSRACGDVLIGADGLHSPPPGFPQSRRIGPPLCRRAGVLWLLHQHRARQPPRSLRSHPGLGCIRLHRHRPQRHLVVLPGRRH